jgi:hypothetical protein
MPGPCCCGRQIGGWTCCRAWRFGFEDRRQPWLISHTVQEMVAQRVYALALGYEDLTDHDQLREDPLLAVLSGKQRVGEEALAGKSTLNRLELGGVRALQRILP